MSTQMKKEKEKERHVQKNKPANHEEQRKPVKPYKNTNLAFEELVDRKSYLINENNFDTCHSLINFDTCIFWYF